jgi:DNA replication protein DnaC
MRSYRAEKTLTTLDLNRFAAPLRGQIRQLLRGEFLAGATNVCLIGRPGTGKSHVMAALGRALVERGHPVLFTSVAALVERLLDAMITSNLVFSKWDQIFKDPMTTAAAIDRVVHHAVVLEFTEPSVRAEAAEQRAALARRDASAPDRP